MDRVDFQYKRVELARWNSPGEKEHEHHISVWHQLFPFDHENTPRRELAYEFREGLVAVYQCRHLEVPQIRIETFGKFTKGRRSFQPITLNYNTVWLHLNQSQNWEQCLGDKEAHDFSVYGAIADFSERSGYLCNGSEGISAQGIDLPWSLESLEAQIDPYYTANYPVLMKNLDALREGAASASDTVKTLCAVGRANTKEISIANLANERYIFTAPGLNDITAKVEDGAVRHKTPIYGG